MNKSMIASLLITASLIMACSQSDDDSAKKKTATTTVEVGERTMKTDAENMVAGVETSEDKTSAMEESTGSQSTLSEQMADATAEVKEEVADATMEAKEQVADATAEVKEEMNQAANETMGALKDATDAKEVTIENKQDSDKAAMAAAKAEVNKQPTEAVTTASADLETGKTIYNQKCVACHGTGATGAPKLDDESWSERNAQGIDVLYEHAIKGFQGAKGYMPAKGGFMGLSDDEVKAAVDYMVSASSK